MQSSDGARKVDQSTRSVYQLRLSRFTQWTFSLSNPISVLNTVDVDEADYIERGIRQPQPDGSGRQHLD